MKKLIAFSVILLVLTACSACSRSGEPAPVSSEGTFAPVLDDGLLLGKWSGTYRSRRGTTQATWVITDISDRTIGGACYLSYPKRLWNTSGSSYNVSGYIDENNHIVLNGTSWWEGPYHNEDFLAIDGQFDQASMTIFDETHAFTMHKISDNTDLSGYE